MKTTSNAASSSSGGRRRYNPSPHTSIHPLLCSDADRTQKIHYKGRILPSKQNSLLPTTFHFGLFSLSATTLQLLLRYRVFKKWFEVNEMRSFFLTIYWFMKPQKCNWILWPFQIWDLGQLNQYTHDLLIWEPSLQTLPGKCWMLKLIYIGFLHIFTHFLRKNFTFFMITFFKKRKSLKRPVVNYEAG